MGKEEVVYIKSRQIGMSNYLSEYLLAKSLGFKIKFEPNKYAAPWLKNLVESKQKMDKILFQQAFQIRESGGQLKVVFSDIIINKTLEELGIYLKEEIDKYINHLTKDYNEHKVTKGVIVYPLIHIVYDELLSEEQKEQINKIYQKRLN